MDVQRIRIDNMRQTVKSYEATHERLERKLISAEKKDQLLVLFL